MQMASITPLSLCTIHYALMKSLQPRRRTDMGTRARPLNHLARATRTKREF